MLELFKINSQFIRYPRAVLKVCTIPVRFLRKHIIKAVCVR